MAIVRNRNKNRDLFSPMEATHTSQFIDNMYDNNEQSTMQTLMDESIVLTGYMIYYVFRTEIDIDKILFEPNTSSFSEAFQIAATFPDYVMGWDNQDALLNKFGMETNPSGEFIISQRAWDIIMEEREAQGLYTFYKPREGDLIVMYGAQRWEEPKDKNLYNQNKTIFQITYTDTGKNSWQLGKDYVWKVSAEAYKYDHSETLDAKDDNDENLFDTIPDFGKPDQSDDYTDEEASIKEFDEENPFKSW